MKSSIDELLKDINQSERTEISIRIHTGVTVEIHPIRYSHLRISKDDKGHIFLGNYESQEGYVITDEYEIIKKNLNGRITYEIRKDEISLVRVNVS